MKKLFFSVLLTFVTLSISAQGNVENPDTVYTVHSIDQDRFKDVIADWGARDWKMAPILREIAHYYQGEVDFYRINVDDNPDIAAAFEIRSIPMLLICPLDGEPKTVVGLYAKQEYIRVINQAIGN